MRREFLARIKAAALKRCMDENGVPRCEGEMLIVTKDDTRPMRCFAELRAGRLFYDHDKADGLGGEPTLSNCKVLCGPCHDAKTHTRDNPIMRKADRSRKRHYGVKARKGPPMPGTKASGLRKRMDGTVERR